MRSACFFALVLVLLPRPVLSQEPPAPPSRDLVWLEPCPEADSSDVEILKARIDCLERRSEAAADSQNLLLRNLLLLLEEQFVNEPAKIVERIPAVAWEAELVRGITAARMTSRDIGQAFYGVPTVINCIPPLMDKAGFVLIGAKLSSWANRPISGEAALSECAVGNPKNTHRLGLPGDRGSILQCHGAKWSGNSGEVVDDVVGPYTVLSFWRFGFRSV